MVGGFYFTLSTTREKLKYPTTPHTIFGAANCSLKFYADTKHWDLKQFKLKRLITGRIRLLL
jgi:hypothetical protein